MDNVVNNTIINRIKGILQPILGNEEEITEVLFPLFCIFRMDELLQPYQSKISEIINNKDFSDYSAKKTIVESIYPLRFYNTFDGGLGNVYSSYDCNQLFWAYYSCFNQSTLELFKKTRFEQLIGRIILENKLYLLLNTIHSELPYGVDAKTFDLLLSSISKSQDKMSNDNLSLLMAKLACNGLIEYGGPVSVLDFSCGYGDVLFATRDVASLQTNIVFGFGNDVVSKHVVFAKLRSFLLECDAVFENTSCLYSEIFENNTFDCVVSRIPLHERWIPEMIMQHQELYPMSFSHYRTDANLLYILRAIKKLNERGRAVILTKQSVLNYNASLATESMIRRYLVEKDLLESLITLPSFLMMPYTKVPVCIWVLSRKKDWRREGRVQLINGAEMFSLDGKPNEKSFSFDCDRMLEMYNAFEESEFCRIVENDSFLSYGFDVVVPDGDGKNEIIRSTLPFSERSIAMEEIRGFGDIDLDTIRVICDFNFDNFFGQKDKIQEPSLQELSDAVVSISRKIVPSFEKLEQEIVNKERKPFEYQKLTDDSWTRLPLIALFKVSAGTRNIQPDYPLISVDLLRDIALNPTEKAMIKTSNGIVESDAIMIIKGANSGEVFRPISGTLSSTLASFSAKENYLDKRFAYYLLKAHQDVFQMLSSGMTVKSIRINDLKSYSVKIPSIQEQQRMAEYLDSIVLKIDEISNALGVKVPAMEDYSTKLISDVVKGIVRV